MKKTIGIISLSVMLLCAHNIHAQYTLDEAVYTSTILKAYKDHNYPKIIAVAPKVIKDSTLLEPNIAKALVTAYLSLADITNPKDGYLMKAKQLVAEQIALNYKRSGVTSLVKTKTSTTKPAGLNILSEENKNKNSRKIETDNDDEEDDIDIYEDESDNDDDTDSNTQSPIIATIDEYPVEENIEIDDKSWLELVQLNVFGEGVIHDFWMNSPSYKAGINFIKRNNYEKAKEALENAASYNNAYAMLKQGEVNEYLKKQYADEPDANFDGGPWFEQAAESHLSAGITMHINYDMSTPGWDDSDLKNYEKLIDENVSLFDPYAYYLKGNLLSGGSKPTQENLKEAYNHYLFAAKYKHQQAIEKIILMHVSGSGVIKSDTEASYWLNQLRNIPNISNALIVKYENLIKTMP